MFGIFNTKSHISLIAVDLNMAKNVTDALSVKCIHHLSILRVGWGMCAFQGTVLFEGGKKMTKDLVQPFTTLFSPHLLCHLIF